MEHMKSFFFNHFNPQHLCVAVEASVHTVSLLNAQMESYDIEFIDVDEIEDDLDDTAIDDAEVPEIETQGDAEVSFSDESLQQQSANINTVLKTLTKSVFNRAGKDLFVFDAKNLSDGDRDELNRARRLYRRALTDPTRITVALISPVSDHYAKGKDIDTDDYWLNEMQQFIETHDIEMIDSLEGLNHWLRLQE